MFQVEIIMFPTTRNLQIRVHVYRPRHCCGDWLTFGCFVPMIADHDLVKKRYKQSWQLRNLSVSCHVGNFSYVVHTEYNYYYFFINWTIISPKEFKSWEDTRISFTLLPRWQNYPLSNILRFALKICFWADF
jgi:hypothetical protein